MIELDKFKEYKKHQIINEDLDVILKVLTLTMSALHPYLKYKPVQEVISNLQNNKTFIEVYSKKMKKYIKEYNDVQSE